jgi:D-sedoheptulose 7-phosphate isomerase
MSQSSPIRSALDEAAHVLRAFTDDPAAQSAVERFADVAETTFRKGGTIYSCGNGGSMCDAMHFAEEWTGRFRRDRAALPALAFSDAAHMTCIANDFGFEQVFARMVDAYAKPGDTLLAISTSGNSPNVLAACKSARRRGVTVVGLLGKGGGPMKELCDVAVVVPLATTSDRIQEVHIKVIHAVIEAVERRLFPANYS